MVSVALTARRILPKFLIALLLVYVLLGISIMMEKLNKLKYVLALINTLVKSPIIMINKKLVITVTNAKKGFKRKKTLSRNYLLVGIMCLLVGLLTLGVITIYPINFHNLDEQSFGKCCYKLLLRTTYSFPLRTLAIEVRIIDVMSHLRVRVVSKRVIQEHNLQLQ